MPTNQMIGSKGQYKHLCSLDNDNDEYYLEPLPPFASFHEKLKQALTKFILVSSKNPRCHNYFRSYGSILLERERQTKNYKYIIHPFSRAAFVREIVMSIAYWVVLWSEPFVASYILKKSFHGGVWDIYDTFYGYYLIAINCFMILDVFINFSMGYLDHEGKVVLERRKIAKNYLLSYFIFDVVTCIPSIALHWMNSKSLAALLVFDVHFLRLVRIGTLFNFFSKTLQWLKLKESVATCVSLFLMTMIVLHWWTCFNLIIPLMEWKYIQNSTNSWYTQAFYWDRDRTKPSNEKMTMTLQIRHYVETFLLVLAHFLAAGEGYYFIRRRTERLTLAFVTMTGFFFRLFAICEVLQLFGMINISETKYEELIQQFNEYSVIKKIPNELKINVKTYYEFKFEKRLFSERAINETLSQHLRCEVLLICCRKLIESACILQGLSRGAIGAILGMIESEIYLPGDIIITPESENDAIYFITIGTVMFTVDDNKEILHLEDGQQFGEVCLMLRQMGEKSFTTVTALEITEVYRIDKKDLKYCMHKYPEIWTKFDSVAKKRLNFYRMLQEKSVGINASEIVEQLKRGRILEAGPRRHRFEFHV